MTVSTAKNWVRVSAALAALLVSQSASGAEATLAIGSKNFTESVILGELATLLVRNEGGSAVHRPALGGTRIAFNALIAGDIDAYAEYTGTIRQEIFAGRPNLEIHEVIRSVIGSGAGAELTPTG